MKTPMPVEVFPAGVRAFIQRVADATETPIELGGMLVLSALATAVQRRVQVRVRFDWVEECTIYTLTVLASGEGKSPVFKHIMKPFHDWERERRNEWDAAMAEYNALDKAARKDAQQPPTNPMRLIASDTTPERLAVLMQQNGERMAVLADEGGILDILGGRYAPKGMVANLDLFLGAWDGERTTIDRQKDGASVYLDRPCLSIGLTVQPTVLEKLAQAEYLRERGLLARFLIAVPESRVGQRCYPDNPPIVDQLMQSNWATLITQLMGIADGTVIGVRDDGYRAMSAYQRALEPRLLGDLESIRPIISKARSQTVRIAALLALANDPHARTLEMGASEIERATTLYDWLIQHQLAAQAISTTLSPQARAMVKLAAWITRQARAAAGEDGLLVTLRQAQQHTKVDRSLLLECFRVMDEYGVVAEEDTRRRDSYRWVIPDVGRVGEFATYYQATVLEG